jgi:hypothetical protein
MLVPGSGANPGTIGSAFDFTVRFTLDSGYIPDIAIPSGSLPGQALQAIKEVVKTAKQSAGDPSSNLSEELVRASWALALSTEVFHTCLVYPGSPLAGRLDGAAYRTPDPCGPGCTSCD